MSSLLNPYVSFNGEARAAMEFYQSALGGELTINTFGEYGQEGTPIADQIMHAQLETPAGFTLMASDTPPGMTYNPGQNISISLSGDDETELRGYWDKIVVDGTITLPLEKQMWGDTFGQCTDKFGLQWMVNIATAQG